MEDVAYVLRAMNAGVEDEERTTRSDSTFA